MLPVDILGPGVPGGKLQTRQGLEDDVLVNEGDGGEDGPMTV